jgi:hypothetical protein
MRPSELEEAMRLLTGAREYRLAAGMFWHNWSASSLTPEVVGRLAKDGAVWRAGSAIAVARAGGEAEDGWEEVCFVGGPPPDALKLVKSLIGRSRGAAERWVFLPQGSPLIHLLREEGYQRNFAMVLFERRAAKG